MFFSPNAQAYYYLHINACGLPVSLTFVVSQRITWTQGIRQHHTHSFDAWCSTLISSTMCTTPILHSKLPLLQMRHLHCVCNGILSTVYTMVLCCCCTCRGGVSRGRFRLTGRRKSDSQDFVRATNHHSCSSLWAFFFFVRTCNFI